MIKNGTDLDNSRGNGVRGGLNVLLVSYELTLDERIKDEQVCKLLQGIITINNS